MKIGKCEKKAVERFLFGRHVCVLAISLCLFMFLFHVKKVIEFYIRSLYMSAAHPSKWRKEEKKNKRRAHIMRTTECYIFLIRVFTVMDDSSSGGWFSFWGEWENEAHIFIEENMYAWICFIGGKREREWVRQKRDTSFIHNICHPYIRI